MSIDKFKLMNTQVLGSVFDSIKPEMAKAGFAKTDWNGEFSGTSLEEAK